MIGASLYQTGACVSLSELHTHCTQEASWEWLGQHPSDLQSCAFLGVVLPQMPVRQIACRTKKKKKCEIIQLCVSIWRRYTSITGLRLKAPRPGQASAPVFSVLSVSWSLVPGSQVIALRELNAGEPFPEWPPACAMPVCLTLLCPKFLAACKGKKYSIHRAHSFKVLATIFWFP